LVSVSAAKASETVQQGLLARLAKRMEEAFSEEERQGLMLAAKTRTVAVMVILVWQAIDSPHGGLAYAYNLFVVASFAVLGFLQYICARQRFYVSVLKYLFVLADCALLALFLTLGNPFVGHDLPSTFAMRGSQFSLFFLFLMQAAFSFRPRLVLWCGLCIVTARTGMLLWITSQPGVLTNVDLRGLAPETFAKAYTSPDFVYLGDWAMEMITALIVAGGLAVVVARSRRLVASRSLAERARANLARYFSPNVVDRLSDSRESLNTIREQDVAVLFADIMGFTQLCERQAGPDVIALLRDYHDRLGRAVFDNHGTLDKYIGDGLMATFGTPAPDTHDAENSLQCAIDMIAALDQWNAERARAGTAPVRVGIGIHYGPVIAGDIGNERRLEYSVIGDTVNIASRLEHLTRDLGTTVVVSDSVVENVAKDSPVGRTILARFSKAGIQSIRGRQAGIPVWTLNETGSV